MRFHVLKRSPVALALALALLPGCIVALGTDGGWSQEDGLHFLSSHEDQAVLDRLDGIESRLEQLEHQCANCKAQATP